MTIISKRLSKSQAYARCIVDLAVDEYGLSVESIASDTLSLLADEALFLYPQMCDIRFRGMAICRIRVFQRFCKRQSVILRLWRSRLL